VERTVRRSRLFRPLVGRFIAGETLPEALDASRALLQKNLLVTLDCLGENTTSIAEAAATRETYIEMLRQISTVDAVKRYRPSKPDAFRAEPLNISVKLTQCGLDLGDDVAEDNYRAVLTVAAESHNFVRVDMEGSAYTQQTIDMVLNMRSEFENTGTVLQSYLYRTDEDLERMIEGKVRIRLVKGAYLEPATVAYPEKSKVDEAFIRHSKRLMKDGFYPGIATHDERIISELLNYAAQESIEKSRFEFQMLYGIRRDLQESLRKEGHNIRVYVPYGDKWYPYFTRRLAERPANTLFIIRTLFKG
jgi:proline dehydrogenase